MIQANELRIGNAVLFAPQGNRRHSITPRVCIVKELYDNTILVEDMGLPLSLFYDSEDLQPIPLTPEILEKNCGFGYIKVDGVSRLSDDFDDFEELQKEFTHNWTLNVKTSEHNDSFRFEIVQWGEQEYLTFAHQWLRVRIKFVHQLQNLYFALTGEELTINL